MCPPEDPAEEPSDEPRWLTRDEQRAWRGLAAVMQLLPTALDRQLRAEAGITHMDYMILAMLSEAPDERLRMSRLSDITSASPSRLSHAVSRLEERGWVERCAAEQDRRGQVAQLTDEGWRFVVDTAPGHVDEVQRLVFGHLDEDLVVALEEITGRILAAIEGDEPITT